MKVLVFDTETTGLPQGKNPSITQTNRWPHIVQLSYVLFDTDQNAITDCQDVLIKQRDGVKIDPKAQEVHGISLEKCATNGIYISDALDMFDSALKEADLVVGHNISFDKRMMMVEAIRQHRSQYFTCNGVRKQEFCTMKNGVNLCRILAINQQTRETYFKYPKLFELHEKLFNYKPAGLHDSLADVLICLRCFLQMNYDKDVIFENRQFAVLWREKCIPMTR